ncbi:MAG: hypothetical protein IJ587_10700 [Synergistaceae bacterium]|nr:hypothetical protein [Synergistaceae bacterium]
MAETTTTAASDADPSTAQQTTIPALFDEPAETTQTNDNTDTTQANDNTDATKPDTQQAEIFRAEDIKLPDGYKYDAEIGQSFAEILNDGNLSRKELGQKLFDLYQSQNAKFLEGMKAAEAEKIKTFEADLAKEKEEWLKKCQADTEYGGQKWEASQAVIDRGCKYLATPEAVALMQSYNLNTHPEIVRMFYRAGKLSGEDSSSISGNGSGKTADPATAIFGESLKDFNKRRSD